MTILQNYLFGLKDVTMIITTKDQEIARKCDLVIHLEKGNIQSIEKPIQSK